MFEHTRPNGQSCFTAFPALNAKGENIAAGQTTAQAAFASWQETNEPYAYQGHRRNMLKATFNAIGIGHVVRDGIHYWTQALGYKASPGGGTTDPADGAAVVEVLISDAYITDRTTALSPESITLDIGQSADLPALSVSFTVTGARPERPYSETFTPQWVAEDGTRLSLTASALTALHAGETRLTADNYAVDVTVEARSLEGAEIAVARAITCTVARRRRSPPPSACAGAARSSRRMWITPSNTRATIRRATRWPSSPAREIMPAS